MTRSPDEVIDEARKINDLADRAIEAAVKDDPFVVTPEELRFLKLKKQPIDFLTHPAPSTQWSLAVNRAAAWQGMPGPAPVFLKVVVQP